MDSNSFVQLACTFRVAVSRSFQPMQCAEKSKPQFTRSRRLTMTMILGMVDSYLEFEGVSADDMVVSTSLASIAAAMRRREGSVCPEPKPLFSCSLPHNANDLPLYGNVTNPPGEDTATAKGLNRLHA